MELFFRHKDDSNRFEIVAPEIGWTWLLQNENEDTGELCENYQDDMLEGMEEGESWKHTSGFSEDEALAFDDIRSFVVYQRAKEFASRALKFVHRLPETVREDSSVVDFVANAMIAGTEIAGGSGIGNDHDELGGNIAYCKRGLSASNLSIVALHEMKDRNIVSEDTCMELMKELIEVRNTIAIHIVELREEFRRGI